MVVQPNNSNFSTSLSYFRDKIDCVRCIPQNKNSSIFHLCSDCMKYFTERGIIGLNDDFNYVMFPNNGKVFRAKLLGKCGICYNSYLKRLDRIWFYEISVTDRDFQDFLKDIVQVDFDENHLLIDFQDNSDEPLF